MSVAKTILQNRAWISSVRLTGEHVRLEPLSIDHHDDLATAVSDGELWKLWYITVPSPPNMRAEIERRLDEWNNGMMLPFAVISNKTNRAIGMTTYFKISAKDKRLDIGWTWYAKSVQKTSVNTEAKLLLLTHAFENLGCIAVGFGANFFNQNSRLAIERLGAKLDGIIRNNRIMPNGTKCDFWLYSIIDSEWPTVKANLRYKLAKHAAAKLE